MSCRFQPISWRNLLLYEAKFAAPPKKYFKNPVGCECTYWVRGRSTWTQRRLPLSRGSINGALELWTCKWYCEHIYVSSFVFNNIILRCGKLAPRVLWRVGRPVLGKLAPCLLWRVGRPVLGKLAPCLLWRVGRPVLGKLAPCLLWRVGRPVLGKLAPCLLWRVGRPVLGKLAPCLLWRIGRPVTIS